MDRIEEEELKGGLIFGADVVTAVFYSLYKSRTALHYSIQRVQSMHGIKLSLTKLNCCILLN